MEKIEQKTVEFFCAHCDWAHQCWLTRKYLYDENSEAELLRLPKHAHFFSRLEKILQEYWILEVVKLHDPAEQLGFKNLSVEYIYNHGEWTPETKKKLTELKANMSHFVSKIKPARHKILSHKDKETIVSGNTLGEFDEGDDVEYFDALREFANKIHTDVIGKPYLFDDLTQNDIAAFISTFSRGISKE